MYSALNLQLFQSKWHFCLPKGMITKALLNKAERDFWETPLLGRVEQEQEETAALVILSLRESEPV